MSPAKQTPTPAAIPDVAPKFTNDQIVNAATGHWGTIADKIKFAEPYTIDVPATDDAPARQIVIQPLTRRRRKALKAAQAAYLLSAAQLAEVSNGDSAGVEQSTMTRIEQLTEQAERRYDEALFGDVVDEVYDFFENQQEEFWDAMYNDVHAKLVNRVEDLPEGSDEAEGKDDSSSTSSTASGTK